MPSSKRSSTNLHRRLLFALVWADVHDIDEIHQPIDHAQVHNDDMHIDDVGTGNKAYPSTVMVSVVELSACAQNTPKNMANRSCTDFVLSKLAKKRPASYHTHKRHQLILRCNRSGDHVSVAEFEQVQCHLH